MVICLYGASSQNIHPDYTAGVEAFGREIGRRGHTLLFGGGDKGLMGAAARGVKAEKGRVIGVAPRFFDADGVLYPNCDEFVYLGGNEQSTHEYVSKLLGRETIDTNSYGRTDGLRGNFSTNFQVAGRELLTPDEVRMLDNRYAIAFIRGESPVYDLKYDILSHPKIAEGRDGGAEAYVHGRRDDAPEIVLVRAEDYGVRAAELPRMEEIIGEFYPNLAAYDENETANLCAFLKGEKTE